MISSSYTIFMASCSCSLTLLLIYSPTSRLKATITIKKMKAMRDRTITRIRVRMLIFLPPVLFIIFTLLEPETKAPNGVDHRPAAG